MSEVESVEFVARAGRCLRYPRSPSLGWPLYSCRFYGHPKRGVAGSMIVFFMLSDCLSAALLEPDGGL